MPAEVTIWKAAEQQPEVETTMQRDSRAAVKCLAVVAMLAAAVAGSNGAAQQTAGNAQFSPPVGVAEAFAPDFVRRDLQLIVDHFDLDAGQQAIVDVLFTDYEQTFEAEASSAREKLSTVRPTKEQHDELRRQNHEVIRREMEILVERIRELQEQQTLEDNEELVTRLKQQTKALQQRMQAGDAGALELDVIRELMGEFDEIIAAWETVKWRLRDKFLADIRVVLSDEQEARWPAFERKLRREKTLPDGVLSGESVDLLALVGMLDLTPEQRAPLESTMAEFELALDRALLARNAFIDQSRRREAELLRDGDQQGAESLKTTEVALRVAVRDVNENYAESLSELLVSEVDAELGESLLDDFHRRAYPRAFRRTRAQRAFDSIVQIPSLDTDVRMSIETLASQYQQQLDTSRDGLIALIRQHEPRQHVERFVIQTARASGLEPTFDGESPLLEAFARLADEDQRYIEQSLEMLSAEQIAGVPAFVRSGTRFAEQSSAAASPMRAPETREERRALAQQYDANGDGVLDETERSMLRKALRELYKKEGEQPES